MALLPWPRSKQIPRLQQKDATGHYETMCKICPPFENVMWSSPSLSKRESRVEIIPEVIGGVQMQKLPTQETPHFQPLARRYLHWLIAKVGNSFTTRGPKNAHDWLSQSTNGLQVDL